MFRTIGKRDGADNNSENFRAFYPGPPSNPADSFGRYLATIVGVGVVGDGGLSGVGARAVLGGTSGQQDSDSTYSAIMNQLMNNKPRLSDFGSGRAGRAGKPAKVYFQTFKLSINCQSEVKTVILHIKCNQHKCCCLFLSYFCKSST